MQPLYTSGFTKTGKYHQIKTLSSSRVIAVRKLNSIEVFFIEHNHMFSENVNHNKHTWKGTDTHTITEQNKFLLVLFV